MPRCDVFGCSSGGAGRLLWLVEDHLHHQTIHQPRQNLQQVLIRYLAATSQHVSHAARQQLDRVRRVADVESEGNKCVERHVPSGTPDATVESTVRQQVHCHGQTLEVTIVMSCDGDAEAQHVIITEAEVGTAAAAGGRGLVVEADDLALLFCLQGNIRQRIRHADRKSSAVTCGRDGDVLCNLGQRAGIQLVDDKAHDITR
ncbi:hypothetical protein Vretimale_10920 [Volvox reticuliferus]|uniref:Uncharacterized protein n=1 Tax=Volvox reticuliferus TaxID=1737510 RepID=A0A8J4CPC4_9CHLO|nr:hypothetical protein Vretifemale_12608 [Volvox reticuliferus]GIM06660.1 hypothetical protein Vretimale_10920 [Volvox reticuliferus]